MRTKILVMGVLAVAAVCGAQTASAPADYSSPKAALRTFAQATVAQDVKTLKAALAIEAGDEGSVNALLGATEASKRLQDAVRAKFGEAGVAELREPGTMERKMTAWLGMLDGATMRQEGDAATFTFAEGAGGLPKAGSIGVKKVGGVWKVTAASAFGLDVPATAAKIKQAIPSYVKIAAAYNEVAAEVEAGKHGTVKSVQDSLMPRVMAALPDSPATQK